MPSDLTKCTRAQILQEASFDTEVVSGIFTQIAAVLKAIRIIAATGTERHQFSHIKDLAELAEYVSNDWANSTDVMHEGYRDAFEAAKKAKEVANG